MSERVPEDLDAATLHGDATEDRREAVEFTPVRAVVGEGARVGFVTCLNCGAALLIDPADERDALGLHRDWHAASDPRP